MKMFNTELLHFVQWFSILYKQFHQCLNIHQIQEVRNNDTIDFAPYFTDVFFSLGMFILHINSICLLSCTASNIFKAGCQWNMIITSPFLKNYVIKKKTDYNNFRRRDCRWLCARASTLPPVECYFKDDQALNKQNVFSPWNCVLSYTDKMNSRTNFMV